MEIVVIFAYISLIAELLLFPVPSIASCYSIMRESKNQPGTVSYKEHHFDVYRASIIRKFLLYIVPTIFCVALFLIPPVLIAFPALTDFFSPVETLNSNMIHTSGIILIIGGRFVTLYSVFCIRRSFKGFLKPLPVNGIVSRGVFRFSRNPGLVGMFVFYGGLFLLFPNLVMAVGFFLYFINMHNRVLMEESFLRENFGDAFLKYMGVVRRYI